MRAPTDVPKKTVSEVRFLPGALSRTCDANLRRATRTCDRLDGRCHGLAQAGRQILLTFVAKLVDERVPAARLEVPSAAVAECLASALAEPLRDRHEWRVGEDGGLILAFL